MPQETDSAREANLRAQRIALLYEALPAALVASIGCALALVIVNWNVLPQGQLLIWLAYQLVISAGRYRLTCSFKARAPAPAAVQGWDRAFVIGTALAGFGWGASTLVLFSPSSPAHQVFLAFVLGGVIAGASSTLAAKFDAFLSFSLPTLLSLALRFFILGTEQALAMGICTLLFSCLMAYTAFRMSNTVSETLRLKYHNSRLVDQLAAQLQEGEQTELLLNVHTEHYRFILEQAQDIFYRTDGNGRFTFINPAVVRLLGYHETELLGHRALDFIHPSHRRTMVNFYIRQFLRKIPSTYYEFPLVTRDGHALWIGQHVQLLQRDREVVGFQAVLRDISARKQAEETLRFSQDRYRALFESSPEMLLTVDAQGTMLTVNRTTAAELAVYRRRIDRSTGHHGCACRRSRRAGATVRRLSPPTGRGAPLGIPEDPEGRKSPLGEGSSPSRPQSGRAVRHRDRLRERDREETHRRCVDADPPAAGIHRRTDPPHGLPQRCR